MEIGHGQKILVIGILVQTYKGKIVEANASLDNLLNAESSKS